jgi:hypothetical protein
MEIHENVPQIAPNLHNMKYALLRKVLFTSTALERQELANKDELDCE